MIIENSQQYHYRITSTTKNADYNRRQFLHIQGPETITIAGLKCKEISFIGLILLLITVRSFQFDFKAKVVF